MPKNVIHKLEIYQCFFHSTDKLVKKDPSRCWAKTMALHESARKKDPPMLLYIRYNNPIVQRPEAAYRLCMNQTAEQNGRNDDENTGWQELLVFQVGGGGGNLGD